MPTSPRISLCMIVRNEARLLPDCLASARGVWDELVVVDTGSTDESVQIAERSGAKVARIEWADDFAAARNTALDLASGEWVLILDADERVSTSLKEQLRAITTDPTVGAATVVIQNRLAHGGRRLSRLLRVFRRDAGIRFKHRIHEDVTESVATYLSRTGTCLAALSGTVEHLGYQRSRMVERDKKARDVALLEAALAQSPDDLYSWFKLLEQARFWNDADLAEYAGRGALAAMAQTSPSVLKRLHFGGDLLARLVSVAAPEGTLAALNWLEARFSLVAASAELYLKRGELRELACKYEAAREDFTRAQVWREAPGDTQVALVRPLLGLSRLRIADGDPRSALALAERALGFNPLDPEALTAVVALICAVKGELALAAFSQVHRAAHGQTPELLSALAEQALLTGDTARASALLRRASKLGSDQWAALRLAQVLLADGQVEEARELASSLMRTLPEAALGVLVCDLIAGRDSRLELQLRPAEADRAFKKWVEMVIVCRRPGPLERLRASAPAVEPFFPWLGQTLAARAAGEN